MTLSNRKDAIAAGDATYFTGKPCKHGHIAKRLVSNRTCYECSSIKVARWYGLNKANPSHYSRTRSMALGFTEYFTGKECINGHVSTRRVSDGHCRDCLKAKDRKRSQENRGYMNAQIKKWKAKNKHKVKAYEQQRRAAIVGADGCHSGSDIIKILSEQNSLCAGCACDLSDGYHVDHIMPLSLGGSNWPNNIQCLCPTCNLRKGAKHPKDWAIETGKLYHE